MRLRLIFLMTALWSVSSNLGAAGENGAAPDEILAQIHFVGSAQMSGTPGASALEELWNLPATVQLKQQTLSKLAKAPFQLVQRRAAPGSLDFALLFRPLLEDLLSSESYLEIRSTGENFPELTWSIRLREEQGQTWKTNLATVASAWTALHCQAVLVEGVTGWELKKHHPPNLMRVLRAGEWLVIGMGQDRLPLQAATVEQIKRTLRPVRPAKDYWLRVLLDGPRLARRFAFASATNFPVVDLTWRGAGERTQADAVITLPADLDWKPATWRVPTNVIRGPLMSFTAAQGLGSWLSQRKELQRYNWLPMPSKIITWTAADNPLETYVAAPEANATNLLEQLAPKIASALNTNLHRASAGAIRWRAKEQEIVWDGVPFIAPFLRAVRDNGENYLLAGLVRGSPRAPTAQDLANHAGGLTNQVYFDWENTASSLGRWRNLSLLLLPMSGKGLMSTESVAAKWLQAIGPKLGQTSTQITATSPNELRLIREGRPGLTGVELVALANWLEATNFPWGGYQVPGRGAAGH